MIKKSIFIIFLICLTSSNAFTASLSNPLSVIHADKYYGLIMMKGISGQWTLPIPVYSDSDVTIYIDAESVDINATQFELLTFGQANLFRYVHSGTLNVAVVVEYKNEKELKKLINNLKEAIENSPYHKEFKRTLYPELLKYRTEWRHYDLKNNEVTFYNQQWHDRDGEILSKEAWQKDVPENEYMVGWPPNATVGLTNSIVLKKTAYNIEKIFKKAMTDPKISDWLQACLSGKMGQLFPPMNDPQIADRLKKSKSKTISPRDEYIEIVWLKIQKNWKLRTNLVPKRDIETIIVVRIAKNGKLESVNFEKRSGNRYFDEKAIETVNESSPFPAFPNYLTDDSIDIGIRFHP